MYRALDAYGADACGRLEIVIDLNKNNMRRMSRTKVKWTYEVGEVDRAHGGV